MRVYILIQAEEGYTGEVFIGRSKEDLKQKIRQWGNEEKACFLRQENKRYVLEEMYCFLNMLDQNENCGVGRHRLPPVSGPVWEECILIVEEI